MVEKLKNLGNLPLVIILTVVIIIAVILSIVKGVNSKETNADTKISDVTRQEEVEQKQEQEPEEEIIFEENVQEIVDETEEEKENIDAKYFIRVNYEQNVVTIYTKDSNGEYTVPYKAMVCSTGTATPRSGTYTIPSGTYSRGTWGLMVGKVWAQYFTRIKGSILFHSVPYTERNKWSLEYWEYDKLGTAASAGCVRLTVEDAKWIYNNCPAGTKVEFYSDSNPGPLGKPSAQKISEDEAVRGWDPTDPDGANPWKTYTPDQEEIEENEPTTPSTTTKPATKPTTKPTTPTTPEETPEETPAPDEGGNSGDEEQNPTPDEGEDTGEEMPTPDEGEDTGEETPTPDEGENTGEEMPKPDEGGNTGEEEPNPGESQIPGGETPDPDTGNETPNENGSTSQEETTG